jgi:acetyltransferase-like isoleucine patch superfamily enzyme
MIGKLILRIWHTFLNKIDFYENEQYKKTFGKFGNGSFIRNPLSLKNTKRIFIGRQVFIYNNARMELYTSYAGNSYSPNLYIDDYVTIQQNLHLTCGERIYIGKKVAITANVTITDIVHSYEDPKVPYQDQKLITKPVRIGEGSLITNGVVITPGSTIGKYCIVASNSVVIGNIPDFSFAAGMPAKIIKKYDFEKTTWERVHV